MSTSHDLDAMAMQSSVSRRRITGAPPPNPAPGPGLYWDAREQVWMEDDKSLRERIRVALGEEWPNAKKARATYLTVLEMYELNHACKPITDAFGTPPYLVGSVLKRPDYRDVDVRLILPDEQYASLMHGTQGGEALLFLNMVMSSYLRDKTGLPIDFQIQARTFANAEFNGPRNALGMKFE